MRGKIYSQTVNKLQIFKTSFFGGIMLGIAGIASALLGADAPLIKAAVFPLGLILITLNSWSLVTGNVWVLAQHEISPWDNTAGLISSFFGNLAGSLLLWSLALFPAAETTQNFFANAAMTKLAIPYPRLFCSAILCNFLVCMATRLGNEKKVSLPERIAYMFFPLFLFVACGFEHVVADMIYLPYMPIMELIPFVSIVLTGNIIGGYCFCFADSLSR